MKRLIIIAGPTGIGKTDLSIEIAQTLGTAIISADSRQIYKEMSIGTAVPCPAQLAAVQHYFIQNISIHDYFNASMFEEQVLELLTDLFKTTDSVVMAGGSGMYIDAVCNGMDDMPHIDQELRKELEGIYANQGLEHIQRMLKKLDPEYHKMVDLRNYKRILKALEICLQTGKPYTSFRTGKSKDRDFEIIKIGLHLPREIMYERIELRVDKMIEAGLVEEARAMFPFKEKNSLNTVGYKELFEYFSNQTDLPTAINMIKQNTRHYAKKQMSWFNRDEKIKWFKPYEIDEIKQFINPKEA